MHRRPSRPADGRCELCDVSHELTFHHLIPRRNHRRAWFKSNFTASELKARSAWLCAGCHRFIHKHFDELALGKRLNTLAALRAEPLIARHIGWAGRQRSTIDRRNLSPLA